MQFIYNVFPEHISWQLINLLESTLSATDPKLPLFKHEHAADSFLFGHNSVS
jgi:hypothetical protein